MQTSKSLLAMAVTALAALGGSVSAPAGELPPKIDAPISHENLAVYFLRGPSAAGPVPLTLQEAMAKAAVIVHETGSVRELRIENAGEEPVFVQSGDLVKGGRQDRVLTVSMALPPKSGQVPIGAYCVEQGRWSARGGEDARRFSASDQQIFSRKAKIAIAEAPLKVTEPVQPHPRTVGGPTGQESPPARHPVGSRFPVQQRSTGAGPGSSGQGAVWNSVATVQQQLSDRVAAPVASARSRTSLQLTLESERLKAAQTTYLSALEKRGLESDDIVGVVIAVNGRIASADMYPSNGLFRKMWPKLVRAAANEALAEKSATPGAVPAVADIERFLAESGGGDAKEHQISGIAKLETRRSTKALRTESRSSTGAWVHRNFLAY